MQGHVNQWAINFRDLGSTIYGGPTTKKLIDHGDTIFNSLPPPKASCSYMQSTGSGTSHAYMASMASINSRSGSCFLGDGLVLMEVC